MTVQDLRVTLDQFGDDMPVRFYLEQHRCSLQYDVNDAVVLTKHKVGDDEGEEAVYLLGTNEAYAPRLD